MNAFCILFTDTYNNSDSKISELSGRRTLASIPFGARYRLIDFMLSALVGASVSDIGIITKSNYGSLMDHIGSGKNWDLDRKNGGLKVLTPFANDTIALNDNQFDILRSVHGYIDSMLEEYCIIADANLVVNLDFKDMFAKHIANGADLTVLCRDALEKPGDMELKMDETGKVNDIMMHTGGSDAEKTVALNVFLLKKSLLCDLIDWGMTYGWKDFGKDVISKKFTELNIFGYKHDGYCELIDSLEIYLKSNLEMLNRETRTEIFKPDQPILTRIKDSVPTKYGDDAEVSNSYIADGCTINGKVENSIIFRNVKVEKGACIKNSIVMQNTIVEENASLNCVIADKNARIRGNKTLSGCDTLPLIINKGKIV